MRGWSVLVLALLAAQPVRAQPTEPAPELTEDSELGAEIVIEAITISGNTATQVDIIRRALPIRPGQLLKQSDTRLRDARFKLLALGYFRDVQLVMRKGSARGLVILDVVVVERGTFVLNKLWFGTTEAAPYWLGLDVGDRNLLGLGIAAGLGVIYAAPSGIEGGADQWATELRVGDGSLRGTRWGAHGSLTLVRGSDFYRVAGDDDDTADASFVAFPYRRFGGRWGATYDVTALSRLSAQLRVESVSTDLPVGAPSDLQLDDGDSQIVTLGVGFDRDTRSDPILPHRGSRFTGVVEVGSSTVGSSYDFVSGFARYEQWWPLRDERHTLGLRVAGGVILGDAPRFDRIHWADVNRMLTPRALGLLLSNASPLDILGTRDDKPMFGDAGGLVMLEYAAQLFRSGNRRVYGGDFFVGVGLWGLASTDDLRSLDATWSELPIDLYIDAGIRIDTDVGIFELTFANALGRLR